MQYFIVFCSRSEAASDVISDFVIKYAGLDLHVKFGDSRSNRFRDTGGGHLVMDDKRYQIYQIEAMCQRELI